MIVCSPKVLCQIFLMGDIEMAGLGIMKDELREKARHWMRDMKVQWDCPDGCCFVDGSNLEEFYEEHGGQKTLQLLNDVFWNDPDSPFTYEIYNEPIIL